MKMEVGEEERRIEKVKRRESDGENERGHG